MNGNDTKCTSKSKRTRFLESGAVLLSLVGFLPFGLICFLTFLYHLTSAVQYVVYGTFNVVIGSEEFQKMSAQHTGIYYAVVICVLLTYMIYWKNDYGAEIRGGHPIRSIRRFGAWKYVADYFPIRLVLSDELEEYIKAQSSSSTSNPEGTADYSLSNKHNYLVGCHPHGVFSLGAFLNFMTDATGFSEKFPKLKPYLSILGIHFKSPVYRDAMMFLGAVSSSKESLSYLLDPSRCKTTGNFVTVVLGGSREVLEANPGSYRLHVKDRQGFFRLALKHGAPMIPCISFGETGMFKQIANPPGSTVRKIQDWWVSATTLPLYLFRGFNVIPRRIPVTTVVGAPIPCEEISNPTDEQIDEVKMRYLDSLKKLFFKYKPLYDPKSKDIEFV
ncbi:unnamed protein product [Calicophoron daubneyi]|uniref:Acyltransferase n=1 Tax=Calicophoron daubneyi TaxID=300641 RepID=A0AAV2T2H8_CALDB